MTPERETPSPELNECAANSTGCSFGPFGPDGEIQCEWCGAERSLSGSARTATSAPDDMPKDWAARFATYAYDMDGIDELAANDVIVCQDAAAWAWQRVLEEREALAARVSGERSDATEVTFTSEIDPVYGHRRPKQERTPIAELPSLDWLFKFASRAYVLLSNLADDDECVSDDHGVCHTHGRGERVCSVAAATALLDEYTEQLDDLAEKIDG